jgi:hypothetical protein
MHPVHADRPGGPDRDRWIRWTTTGSVLLLAAIAAVVSYRHMHTLTLAHGESRWTAALIPLSVDGMIVASSMTLLADSRLGRTGGLLPWTLLAAGSTASLAANVAVAEPTPYGRLIAAWPSFALIGAYELLMRQIRHAAGPAAHQAIKAGSRDAVDAALPTTTPDTADAGPSAVPARLRPAGFAGRARSGEVRRARRRLDGDLLTRARRVDAEHRAQHGRPASAETLRVRLRVGSASARHIKDLVRQRPPAPTASPAATATG